MGKVSIYMAMIRYILVVVFCLILKTDSYAQGLRITFSVNYDNTPVYIRYLDSVQKTGSPQLIITYENLSGCDLYFKKIVGENELLPVQSKTGIFMVAHTIASIKEGNEKITIETQSSNQVFDVDFSIPFQFYENDFIYDLKIYLRNKRQQVSHYNSIEVDIELLNDILAKQIFLNRNDSGKQLIFFKYPRKKILPYSDVSNAMWLAKPSQKHFKVAMENDSSVFPVEQYKSTFCFLKKNESYIEKVNLLPLMVIGGTYNFTLKNQVLKDYLNVYPADLLSGKSPIKMKLPKYVGTYSLYTGTLKANDLSVTFEGKKVNGYIIIGKK